MSAKAARIGVLRLARGRVLRGFNVHHATTVYAQPFEGPPGSEAGTLERIVDLERRVAEAMGREDFATFAAIVRDGDGTSPLELVWESRSGSLSRAVARAAATGVAALEKKLLRRARRRRWAPGTAAWAREAHERGIPWEPLAGAYLRLGEGAVQHVVSADGSPKAALDAFYPDGESARIPVALVVGERGTERVASELEALLRAAGGAVGLTTRRRTSILGEIADPRAHGSGDASRFLLGDPRVEQLVCADSPGRIVRRGLRLEHASVVAILDPGEGSDPDTYRRGIDVAVAATGGEVIVAEENPEAERLVRALDARRITIVSRARPGELARRHRAAGGGVAFREGGRLVVRRGGELLATVPAPAGGARRRRALFAAALALGLGVPGGSIEPAFETRRFLRA